MLVAFVIGSARDDPPLSDLSEGIEIQMDLEFCVWRDSQIMKIILLLTAIQGEACILISHAFRQGGRIKKEIRSYLEGIGKGVEMVLDLGAEKKDVWGIGVASWRPHRSC